MGKKFKVLLYESMHQEGTALLEEKCDVIYARSYDEKELIDQVSDVNAVIIRANGAVTEKIIEAAPKLKVIGRHGVGLDAIDLPAANKRISSRSICPCSRRPGTLSMRICSN
jgi:D-3-phosphoglycerate dehydrogenase